MLHANIFKKKDNLANSFKLYQIKIPEGFDLIEIGGGYGDLGSDLINAGYNLVLFLEPDKRKYESALEKIKNVYMLNKLLSEVDVKIIKKKSYHTLLIIYWIKNVSILSLQPVVVKVTLYTKLFHN